MKFKERGVDRVSEVLEAKRRYIVRATGANNVRILLTPSIVSRSLAIARTKLSNYPPARPSSRYQRTRRLFRAWKADLDTNKVLLINDAKDPNTGRFYAEYVFGKFQPRFHAETGWNKESDVITAEIVKPMFEGVRDALNDGLVKAV